MLSPYGRRHSRLLSPEEVYAPLIEGDLISETAIILPSLLVWNPEEQSGGLDLILQVDADLDLGDSLTDPLESGLYPAPVLEPVTVPAGTFKRVSLHELTMPWLQDRAGVDASWKIQHRVTVTNPSTTDSVRVHLFIAGFIEDTIDPRRRPLFALVT